MKELYKINALWDDEAQVWCAEGVNIPGLCTEAATMELLIKKLEVMVPEMLEANGLLAAGEADIPFELTSKIHSIVHFHG